MTPLVALIACTAITTSLGQSDPGVDIILKEENCILVKTMTRKQCMDMVNAFAKATPGAVHIIALDPKRPVARFACEKQ